MKARINKLIYSLQYFSKNLPAQLFTGRYEIY